MKKLLAIGIAIFVVSAFCGSVLLVAEETATSTSISTGTSLKAELSADRELIASEKAKIKSNAQNAHSEEKALRDQIKAAKESGDKAKAKELRAQLKTTHQENVQQMKTDKASLHAAKKEYRQDKKAAHSRR